MTGPSWATIDPKAGTIAGTPAIANIGTGSWQVTVTDSLGATATTTVEIAVAHLPPVWTVNPIALPDANDAAAYSSNIGGDVKASDPGDTVTITKGSNVPAWLSIATNGAITATPVPANDGSYSFTVIATDQAGATASATVTLKVDHVDLPPTWAVNPITFTTPEDQAFTASIAADAVPYTGATISYSLVSGPNWLTVSPSGALSGTPVLANEGINNFVVRVTDNYGKVATPDHRWSSP